MRQRKYFLTYAVRNAFTAPFPEILQIKNTGSWTDRIYFISPVRRLQYCISESMSWKNWCISFSQFAQIFSLSVFFVFQYLSVAVCPCGACFIHSSGFVCPSVWGSPQIGQCNDEVVEVLMISFPPYFLQSLINLASKTSFFWVHYFFLSAVNFIEKQNPSAETAAESQVKDCKNFSFYRRSA